MQVKKRVLLLAVSCKRGGLCPGGIDLDNPSKWIRIVRDDCVAGSVQWPEINNANPLDIIEFVGHPVPLGIQVENWAIDNFSCRKVSSVPASELDRIYDNYGYHGFWNTIRAYLTDDEYEYHKAQATPSESLIKVNNIYIYRNNNGKHKINFTCQNIHVENISMTDPDFFIAQNDNRCIAIEFAIIVVAIPTEADFIPPGMTSGRGYKFVSKVFAAGQIRYIDNSIQAGENSYLNAPPCYGNNRYLGNQRGYSPNYSQNRYLGNQGGYQANYGQNRYPANQRGYPPNYSQNRYLGTQGGYQANYGQNSYPANQRSYQANYDEISHSGNLNNNDIWSDPFATSENKTSANWFSNPFAPTDNQNNSHGLTRLSDQAGNQNNGNGLTRQSDQAGNQNNGNGLTRPSGQAGNQNNSQSRNGNNINSKTPEGPKDGKNSSKQQDLEDKKKQTASASFKASKPNRKKRKKNYGRSRNRRKNRNSTDTEEVYL